MKSERRSISCIACGKMLGVGYYFICHVCGNAYCFSHMPEKCDHRVRVVVPVQ